MNLLADEGVERQIVVHYIAEMDPGISDDAVLRKANDHNALLLTEDKDFGELVFRQNKIAAGVVLLRLSGISISAKLESVSAAFKDHCAEMTGSFSVLSPGMIRIRHRI